jgi:hypothetical protein
MNSLFQHRSMEDNNHTVTIRMQNRDFVDNYWVVPYSPLLSKIFKTHINVEYCNSIQSIKYICKYEKKGSNIAVFEVAADNSHDEIAQYQMRRYISTNEDLWRIYSYPMHE